MLNRLNDSIIKVELHRAQIGLTQCYNCQNIGHVWANCKKPPRCLWCGGGHLHIECPERTNAQSTSSCCNCTLVGDKPHPASYRDCSHAKGEEHNDFPRDSLGESFSFSSPHQRSPTQLHCGKTLNASNYTHRREVGKACGTPCSGICHNKKFRKQVCQYRLPVRLTMTR
jgi:hypothetical protein